ncbi:phenol hydroxylase [Aspergillus bertholletiae]|uniref:Phenol hydroxylase n=1 Tax=Aspergillus bertholletiae TaxID=1226010 RepID=A0A5N7BJ56_9EURO|nr:phenol hydroxylase [Aspergillus bertholletiae]
MIPSVDNEGYSSRGPIDASTTVVVVGAGSSGLTLACNLARFGIDIKILDDRPDKTSTGKADGMQSKTIEIFKQMRLADPLLRNAARVYNISFWQSMPDRLLHRAGRQTHYLDHLVGVSDPYILLAHQGMVEEVLIDDMEARGVFVMRNSRFASCSYVAGTGQLDIAYEDLTQKTLECIPDAQLEGEVTNASWGVLDGVIDAEHCEAFLQGEAALAKNFDENIRFISGMGAEYSQGLLSRGRTAISNPLRPGTLQLPGKVTRYIDANPVSIQLDVPMLSQFRIYFFVPDVPKAFGFLSVVCEGLHNATGIGKISSRANQSYANQPPKTAPSDTFMNLQRYTSVSSAFIYAMVTQSSKSEFEIADLPKVLQDSRWTVYLDDVDTPCCTDKWIGPLQGEQAGIVILRPDGYVGTIETWELAAGTEAEKWIDNYFAFMM